MGGGDGRLTPVRRPERDRTRTVVIVVGVLHERNGAIAVPPVASWPQTVVLCTFCYGCATTIGSGKKKSYLVRYRIRVLVEGIISEFEVDTFSTQVIFEIYLT